VSFRFRDGTQVNGVPVAAAVDAITRWVADRRNDQPTAEALAHLREPDVTAGA